MRIVGFVTSTGDLHTITPANNGQILVAVEGEWEKGNPVYDDNGNPLVDSDGNVIIN